MAVVEHGEAFRNQEVLRINSEMASTGNASAALSRARLHNDDLPLYTPALDAVWSQLDLIVATGKHAVRLQRMKRAQNYSHAAVMRMNSIAGHRAQVDFYYRVASSPHVRTVCEVGFNAGHSTALWLVANPTLRVMSFDVMQHRFSNSVLAHLKSLFPNRIVMHVGSSANTIRSAPPFPSPCDVVHVDGQHSYEYTVRDGLSLLRRAAPHALFLFDDQCDPGNCTAPTLTAGLPSVATCDLVHGGVLTPLKTFYAGHRQFVLFVTNASAHARVHALAAHDPPLLPCSTPCELTWASSALHRKWQSRSARALRKAQRLMRPPDCV